MILYFSGTGNSRYVARRMADALHEPLCNMNDRIKAGDTAPVETGARLIIVTPTYAWRIPRIVQDWLLRTALTGTAQAWFVMTCGSEIGSADKYNRALCQEKHLTCMAPAPLVVGEERAGDYRYIDAVYMTDWVYRVTDRSGRKKTFLLRRGC